MPMATLMCMESVDDDAEMEMETPQPSPTTTSYVSVDTEGFEDVATCLDTVNAYLRVPQRLDTFRLPGSHLPNEAALSQRQWMKKLNTVVLDAFKVTPEERNTILTHALLLFQHASILPGTQHISDRVLCAACAHLALKFESQQHEPLDDEGKDREDILAAEMSVLTVLEFDVRPLHDYATPLFTILGVPPDIVDTCSLLKKELLFYPFIWYGKSNMLMTCATLLVATTVYCNSETFATQDILSSELLQYVPCGSGCPADMPLLDLRTLPVKYLDMIVAPDARPAPPQCASFVNEIYDLQEHYQPLVPIIMLPRSYVYSLVHMGLVDDVYEVVGMAQHILSSLYIQYS